MSHRRSTVVFALAALALVGALVLSGCVPASQAAPQSAAESAARVITVVGRGEVKARPDLATTTIGVEVLAPSVDAAMTQAKAQMQSVVDALKKLGIADKDIQTSNFSVNFERSQSDTPAAANTAPAAAGQPAGFYRVSNMVQVNIRDLSQIAAVLDAAIKAGANNVWGIDFRLEDTSKLEEEARAKAVDDARSRAQDLARLNGVTLGNVVSVSEVVTGGAVPMFAAGAKGFGGGGGTPVEPGELSFDTQIQIAYAIQ